MQQINEASTKTTKEEIMKIHDDHLYHGAALTQIAEDDQFTAINALKLGGKTTD